MKILVVDDEKNILRTVSLCLESAQHQVVTAVDGAVAVEKAFDEDPDLILLDLLLPRMNGFLVIEALKADARTASIPIVVVSGKAQDEDVERALTLGADDFLVKPFSPAKLLERVNKFGNNS